MSKQGSQLREIAYRLLAIADAIDGDARPASMKKRVATASDTPVISVDLLRSGGRSSAAAMLELQSKKDIERLFRESGGSSTDAKRPKHEVIQRILHRVFDFDAGQTLLRGPGPNRDSSSSS